VTIVAIVDVVGRGGVDACVLIPVVSRGEQKGSVLRKISLRKIVVKGVGVGIVLNSDILHRIARGRLSSVRVTGHTESRLGYTRCFLSGVGLLVYVGVQTKQQE